MLCTKMRTNEEDDFSLLIDELEDGKNFLSDNLKGTKANMPPN